MSRTPSRASSYAGSQHETNGGLTALLGASKAFGRPVASERQSTKTHGGGSAAQQAATVVRGGNASDYPYGSSGTGADRTHASLQRSYTGGASSSTAGLDTGGKPFLSVPTAGRPPHNRSASAQAAAVAASRSPGPQPTSTAKMLAPSATSVEPKLRRTDKPAAPPKPRRLSEHASKFTNTEPETSTDIRATGTTTSLVDLFERNSVSQADGARKSEPVVIKPSKRLLIESPKPVRKSDGITSMFALELEDEQTEPLRKASIATSGDRDDQQNSDDDMAYVSASEELRRSSIIASRRKSMAPKLPAFDVRRPSSAVNPIPSLSPPRPANATSSAPRRIQQPVQRRPASAASSAQSDQGSLSASAHWQRMHPKRTSPLHTGDQLATAMVASSLASSRAPSPTKLGPPPPVSRGRHHHHHHGLLGRTPSPKKKPGMRHTMRQQEAAASSDDEPDSTHPYHKHKTKRIVRKHPHKHHEGDRKRWLDAVTERERKRYEGVWAANKGMHISFTLEEQEAFRRLSGSMTTVEARNQAATEVANIVAREIWFRSRLPEETLEIVWALVDTREVGRLTKQEFVVGMWLIDQRLKGRKLPPKVTDSVWSSVTGVGVKLKR